MSSPPSTRPRAARRRTVVAGLATGLLAALALGLAACGGSSGGKGVASAQDAAATQTSPTSTTAAGGADREEAMLRFARCMRDQGVDFPDPKPDASGNLRFTAPPGAIGDIEELQAARDACRRYLPAGGPGNMTDEERAAFQDAALDFARCMRKEGIDMPDPQVDGRGGAIRALAGIDREDPKFVAAQEKCEHFIRDVVPGGAPGPGGG